MPNDQSHDPRVALPANRLAQAVALSVAARVSSFIDINYSLNQVQAIFAALNTEAAPVDAIWASALAPDQADGDLTQDGSESNPYSVRRAIYSATPGKHVLLKDDGTYSQDYVIQTSSQYDENTYVQPSPNIIPWNMVEPTSSAERIVIRGAPGTCPVFDLTTGGFDAGMDFLEFSHLRINNAATAFGAGSSADYANPCQGLYIHHVCGEFYRQIGGGVNVAFFSLGDASAEGVGPVIEHCFIKGNSSSANQNNACFFATEPNKFTVRNNYFSGVQAGPVYFKHGNDYLNEGGSGAVDIVFENNYIEGNVRWAGSYGVIENNIITGSLSVISDGGGQSTDQKHNTITRNTVLGIINLSKLDWDSENNSVTNNVCGGIHIQTGGAAATNLDPATNTNASDHNLINAVDDGQRFLWDTTANEPPNYKTLSEWQSYINLDANSVVANNQLVGAGTYSALSDFELVGGSVGLTLSDTNGPVGANVSLVGIQ